MKKNNFEDNLKKLDEIIQKLEDGELALDESIKEYEKAMKILKESSDILSEAEGKILKVLEANSEIKIEEI